MAKSRILQVKESTVSVITQNEIDYINLTDMAASFREGSGLISKWVTNKNTREAGLVSPQSLVFLARHCK